MAKSVKTITYRFYDKQVYLDFFDKTSPRHDDLSFQDFVTLAIKDYLAGNYNPSLKEENQDE